jgi:hypothetical protein
MADQEECSTNPILITNQQKETFADVILKHSKNIQKKLADHAAGCDMGLFWKLINKQRTRRDKIYPEIMYKNVTATDPESVANLFASYYTDVYTPENKTDVNKPHLHEIDSTYMYHNIKKLSQNDFHQIDDITHTEILHAITSLKLRKAPGTNRFKTWREERHTLHLRSLQQHTQSRKDTKGLEKGHHSTNIQR